MAELPSGLVAWAGREGPSIVLDAVRRRARRGHATERGALREDLSDAQRAEVARLLGTRWNVTRGPVRLQDLGAALAEHGFTVRGFVEALDGEPLIDQLAVRAEQRAAAAKELDDAEGLVTATGIAPETARIWLADPGLPNAGNGELLALVRTVVRVLRRLPASPPQRLAQLAAAELSDAHALDYAEMLGRVVSRLVALAHDLPRPMRAGRDWRRAWAAVGVRCDGVSSRVLVLNLPISGAAPAVCWCAASMGEPLWLSLRSITGQWSAPAGRTVFVCENPTVLEAAADELGSRCPPLVCTDGIPSIAALDLLSGLADARCEIVARADVDQAGFVVVDQLRSAVPTASAWRFDRRTYARHFQLVGSAVSSAGGDEVRFEGIRELYERHRLVLHEEAILDQLIGDLAAER